MLLLHSLSLLTYDYIVRNIFIYSPRCDNKYIWYLCRMNKDRYLCDSGRRARFSDRVETSMPFTRTGDVSPVFAFEILIFFSRETRGQLLREVSWNICATGAVSLSDKRLVPLVQCLTYSLIRRQQTGPRP